ncbi:NACHT, LRR and PYD domains-containing protein 12-like isoform X2 [Sardina pilchardus]|uniref:NACHT, LRR and PYD domains-containing protein 12-like isoform X2 n=1 Tax=Sardina pilchardus TaxID=27697 RepID=UPI002E0FF46D
MTAALNEVLRKTLDNLSGADFKRFKCYLRDEYGMAWGKLEKADTDDAVDLMVQVHSMGAGAVTLTILQKMNHNQLAVNLESDLAKCGGQQCSTSPAAGGGGINMNMSGAPAPQQVGGGINMNMSGAPVSQQGHGSAQKVKILKEKLQTHLRTKFSAVHQDTGVKNVEDIYTDLYIVEGRTGGVTNAHEVSPINMNQIGRGPSSEDKQVNLANMFTDRFATKVLTLGIAGVGKTVAVQKFVTDWANGGTNQDIDFVFVLLFRKLNLIMEKDYTFLELLLAFYTELKDLTELSEFANCKIIFVLDGMDESKLHLDFEKCISELNEKTSVDILMTSLIKGTLLSTAHIWVTTRPAAASLIPDECINFVTEVRGFNDDQKDQFFQKNINNKEKAEKLILYIKKNKSLHIMCHIPVFCRIIASVVDEILGDQSKEKKAKTLTEMYTLYTCTQLKRMNEFLDIDMKMSAKEKGQLLVKLGKLAFKHLEKGALIFYKHDLKACGIDVRAGALQAGVCTQIFNVEGAAAEDNIFSFVHLSVQEFLAALYVLNKNATCYLGNRLPKTWRKTNHWLSSPSRFDLYMLAVDKALQSQNGHLDLFVRFLLGLAPMLEPQIRSPLNNVLPQLAVRETCIKNTVQYIKEVIKRDDSPERTINLFHCLNELGDNSLIEEINGYINSADEKNLTPAQCSALAYLLLMSTTDMEEFNLKKYLRSEEGLHRMLPVVNVTRRVWLNHCQLTKASGKLLASVLQRTPSHLRELDMSNNGLQDKGVKLLCVGLRYPQCKLEILRLAGCKLTEESCKAVASAMESLVSLRELDLSDNDLKDSGVQLLVARLSSPHCKLQTLRLAGCKLTEESCKAVASAMETLVSLTELDLSHNDLKDSGVQLLVARLRSHHCKLQTLRLADCKLTEESCKAVASAMETLVSLTELDLSHNDLKDSGVQLLVARLSSPHCKLQTLRLSGCLITHEGCSLLSSALKSNPSYLKQLDLSYNHPGDSGVKQLTERLNDPNSKLETFMYDSGGKCRIKPGPRKYACELTLDPNTVRRTLSLSEGNRKVTHVDQQPYPDHPERFDYYPQVLCREGLTGRCYWEAVWSGGVVEIAVAYKSTPRREGSEQSSVFGSNAKSWSLHCSGNSYTARHNSKETAIPVPSYRSSRVGVYLDWPAGTLSFYSVSSNTLTHLHTVHSTFTEPLYPGFFVYSDSSVSLCQIT